MNSIASGASNVKKQEYFAKLTELALNIEKVIVVNVDNIGSNLLANIRYGLRGKAVVLMGKNTMIKTCLKKIVHEKPQLQKLIDCVERNIGLVFCIADPAEVQKIISTYKVAASARQNTFAQCDVFVPAGPTGMDPGQTSFFQSLSIATKIVKGQIEIINDIHLIHEGEKITASQVVLLSKLNITPFTYSLRCVTVYDNGTVYPAELLNMNKDTLSSVFTNCVSELCAFSVGAKIPNICSLPMMLSVAYTDALAFAIGSKLPIPEVEEFKQKMSTQTVSAQQVETSQPTANKAVDQEEEEEDEGFDLGLFD